MRFFLQFIPPHVLAFFHNLQVRNILVETRQNLDECEVLINSLEPSTLTPDQHAKLDQMIADVDRLIEGDYS
jgi:hypothetical protein